VYVYDGQWNYTDRTSEEDLLGSVKDDMTSFGLSLEDMQIQNRCKIEGAPGYPSFTWTVAVKK